MPIRRKVTTIGEAYSLINVTPNQRLKDIVARLQNDGRSEKSISFAIWKSQEKLRQFTHDPRFYSIFENEVKKWAWSSKGPRWIDYNKRKEEEKAKIEQQKKEEEEKKLEEYKKKYPGFIYFIQGENGGPIKIGFTENISKRLKGLQTGHCDNLVVLATFPGKMQNEKDLHSKYGEIRLRGEWFKPTEELIKYIKTLKL